MKKVTILLILAFIVSVPSCKKNPTDSDSDAIQFKDTNFEALIRETLNIPNGSVTPDDMLSIKILNGRNKNISDISEIDYCTELENLDLMFNQISDLSPLNGLINLKEIWVHDNQISIIGDFSQLDKLETIGIGNNQLTDISGLAGLDNILNIAVEGNQISDIGVISGLSSLVGFFIKDNQIQDISALANLPNLYWIELSDNQISDINPLVQNSGLGNGDVVDIASNPLSETSINTYIPQLQARGVYVHY